MTFVMKWQTLTAEELERILDEAVRAAYQRQGRGDNGRA